jgi:hypothetical protein
VESEHLDLGNLRMGRLAGWIVSASLVAGLAGCCAGPCRFYQNAYGFEDPNIEWYAPGPPPPVTTPPGYTTPAVASLPAEDVTGDIPGDQAQPSDATNPQPTEGQPTPQQPMPRQ